MIRRPILLLLVPLLQSACSSSSEPPAPPEINGRYVLQSVDGRPLPFVLLETMETRHSVIADTIEVTNGRDVVGRNVNRTDFLPAGAPAFFQIERRGTWRRISDTLVLSNGAPPTDSIFLSHEGFRLRTGPYATCTANPCNWFYRRIR